MTSDEDGSLRSRSGRVRDRGGIVKTGYNVFGACDGALYTLLVLSEGVEARDEHAR